MDLRYFPVPLALILVEWNGRCSTITTPELGCMMATLTCRNVFFKPGIAVDGRRSTRSGRQEQLPDIKSG